MATRRLKAILIETVIPVVNADSAIDPRHFRNVLGNFPTGVVAITSTDECDKPVGMAVGSFTSVSLDPPLVAFFPDKVSTTFPTIERSGRFCVSILNAQQQDVCRRLSLKGVDKFANISWTPAGSGAPRIDGAIGWIDCDIDTVHDAGDHYIVVGRVRDLQVETDHSPLIFFQGGYGRFASTSLTAPAEADLFQQLRYVDRIRDEMSTLANEFEGECCASTAIGDQLVLIGSSVADRLRTAPHTRLGQRMPFLPPLAVPLIAWEDSSKVTRWMSSSREVLDQDALAAAVDRVRDRGWSLVLESDQQRRFERAVAALPLRDASREQTLELTAATKSLILDDYEPALIHPDRKYDVRVMSVPVFDDRGSAVLLLSLYKLGRPLSGAEINDCCARLVTVAAAATAAIGGAPPP